MVLSDAVILASVAARVDFSPIQLPRICKIIVDEDDLIETECLGDLFRAPAKISSSTVPIELRVSACDARLQIDPPVSTLSGSRSGLVALSMTCLGILNRVEQLFNSMSVVWQTVKVARSVTLSLLRDAERLGGPLELEAENSRTQSRMQ